MKYVFFIGMILVGISCDSSKEQKQLLHEGVWRSEVLVQGDAVPFLMDIEKKDEKYQITIVNGDEKFVLNDVLIENDSLKMKLHIFDVDLKAKIFPNRLEGVYVKNYASDYILPFHANFGETKRFKQKSISSKFDGKWEITFTDDQGNKNPCNWCFFNQE